MQIISPLVLRARAHADRFPRVFWILLGTSAIGSLTAGLSIPYFALFLTSEVGASGVQTGALLAVLGGIGLIGAPLGGLFADRLGRRRTILLGLSVGSFGALGMGAFPTLFVVTILTPIFGVSSDITAPASSAATLQFDETRDGFVYQAATAYAFYENGREEYTDVTSRLVEPILTGSDFERWRDRVCTFVARNLTPAEWRLYVPARTYRRTCQ